MALNLSAFKTTEREITPTLGGLNLSAFDVQPRLPSRLPQKQIDILREAGIPIISTLQTEGLLFGKEAIKKAEEVERRKKLESVKDIVSAIFQGVLKLPTKGEEFRRGILAGAAAIESTLGIAAKKVGFEQISEKLLTLAEQDADLAKVGIEIRDPQKFSDAIKDPEFVASGIARNAPNLLLSIGAAITATAVAGPIAGGVVLFGIAGALEGGFAFREAKDAGLSDDQATSVATKVGIVNGLLESLPVANFLRRTGVGNIIRKRILRRVIGDIILQVVEESATESLQEIVSNVVARSYDENRDLLAGVPESAYFGALLGGGAGLGGAVITQVEPSVGLAIKEVEEVPKELQPLAQEARKFKTAEEFVENLKVGDAKVRNLFTNKTDTFADTFLKRGDAEIVFITPKQYIRMVSEGTFEVPVETTLRNVSQKRVAEIVSLMKSGKKVNLPTFIKGQTQDGVHRVLAAEKLGFQKVPVVLEKSQLTDFFNQVKGVEKPPIPITAKKLLKQEPAPFVKRRETTLLRNKLRDLARGAREATIFTKRQIKGVQTELLDILDKSGLEAIDKAKFLRAVKNIDSLESFRKVFPEIEERIVSLQTAAERRTLKAKIKSELKGTITKKVAGKPVGKFTPELQKVFNIMSGAIKLTREQAEARIIENIAKGELTGEMALENRILSILTGDSDIGELSTVLAQIEEMKETGRVINELRKFNIQEQVEALRAFAIDTITGGKGIDEDVTFGEIKEPKTEMAKTLKSLGKRWVLDWHGLMETLDFNIPAGETRMLKEFGTLQQDNKYKELEMAFSEDFSTAISESYNVENKKNNVHKKILELIEPVNLGTFKNRVGVEGELVMTKDELIKRWMELQDPTLRLSLIQGNKYTDEIIKAIENALTANDKKFARAQFAMYKQQWEKINPIYREIYGIDLPFNEFYSPIRRRGFKVDETKNFGEFLIESNDRLALTSKSFISRTKNQLPLETQSSINTLHRHIKETDYFIAFVKQIRKFGSTFRNTEVREAIKQEFGSEMMRAVDNGINDLTTNGNKNARRYKPIDFFRKGYTIGALAIKPVIGIKQLISTVAYLEKLSAVDFTAGVIDFWRNPVKNWKTLHKESVLIRTRGANMERDIKAAQESDIFKKFNKKHDIINTIMLNVRIGDKGAIVIGSWAMRKSMLKQGIPIEDIITAYENFSASTQQSADVSRLSEVQRGGSLEQLFTMFRSSPRQYYQKELNAIKTLFQENGFGSENIKRVSKTLLIYHVILPFIFQYVANLGGWSEEDRREYLRAIMLGSLNGLFIFGDIIDSILRQALGLRVWDLEIPITQIGNSIQKAIRELDSEDISPDDFWRAISELAEVGNSIGIPVTQTKNMFIGASDILQGDVQAGVAGFLGWSEFRTKKLKRKKGLDIPSVQIPSIKFPSIKIPSIRVPSISL